MINLYTTDLKSFQLRSLSSSSTDDKAGFNFLHLILFARYGSNGNMHQEIIRELFLIVPVFIYILECNPEHVTLLMSLQHLAMGSTTRQQAPKCWDSGC